MNRRIPRLAAVLVVLAGPLVACGGDSRSALSTEEFIDRMATVCDDLQSDLDALGEPADNAALATLARKAGNLLSDARAAFGDITPPDALRKDYADFLEVIDQQIRGATELKNAARDGDEVAVEKAGTALSQLVDEKDAIADDLGIPECMSDDAPTDTVPSASTLPSSDTTTAPVTVPVVTLPITLVPDTQPGVDTTVGGNTGGSPFEILDLTTIYRAPAGYRLVADAPDTATIELFSSDPDLAATMAFVGVAELVDDSSGEQIAVLWFAGTYANDVAMPESWKIIDCPEGEPVTSPAGVVGTTCAASPDSGYSSIFTATDGAYGISVYTMVDGIDPVQMTDAFLLANV